MKTEETGERIWEFDYLKAFSIILVIITHAYFTEAQRNNPLFPYLISLAVPVFMVISGYVNAMSCDRKGITSYKEWFDLRQSYHKIRTIYFSFIIVFAIECIIKIFINRESLHIKDIIYGFIVGGWGPGSYYIPMLIQLIIVFPFIYFCIQKNPVIGSAAVLLIQLLLEISTQIFQMSEQVYRLLFFRYIVFLWFGILLYKYKEQIGNKVMILSGAIGAVYIFTVNFTEFEPFIFKFWKQTSMPTIFWIIFIVLLAMRSLQRFPRVLDKVVVRIGVSTYHIFLVQMVFYLLGMGNNYSNLFSRICINVIVCCGVGVLFKTGEDYLWKVIRNRNF